MHEVDDDGDGYAAAGGFGGDPGDLVGVAVGERDPGPGVVRVAAFGLVEDGGDDVPPFVFDAGGQPFAGGGGPGCFRGGRAGGGGAGADDVGGGASRCRGDVVDGADFGHPLAGADLALRQPGGELGGGPGRRGGCAGAQRLRPHHHALAVAGQDQQVIGCAGWRGPAGRVEGGKVRCGRPGEVFHLAFADPLAGRAADRGHRVIEGAAGAFGRRQPGQPVRMLAGRQVQQPIGRVQAGRPGRPVGDPGHRHLTEHRGQRPLMTALRPGPRHLIRARHIVAAGLGGRAQIQMIL